MYRASVTTWGLIYNLEGEDLVFGNAVCLTLNN